MKLHKGWLLKMKKEEFVQIRHILGRTQDQLAALLCISPKAVQSFEQGWRKIPAYVEREMLLYLALKNNMNENMLSCWDILNCPDEWRDNCVVWELRARHFCWFMSGTYCQGKTHGSWSKKIELCRECIVFKSMLSI